MQLPKVFFGRYADVRKAVLSLLRKVRKGATLAELEELHDTVDPKGRDARLLLAHAHASVAAEAHFQCFVLTHQLFLDLVDGRVPRTRQHAFSAELLTWDWGVLSLMDGTGGDLWLADLSERQAVALVRAVAFRWQDFCRYGERYFSGSSRPLTFRQAAFGFEATLRGWVGDSRAVAQLLDRGDMKKVLALADAEEARLGQG